MAATILDPIAHTVDTNVGSFAVSAGSNRVAYIALIGYLYTTGATAPTSCTLGGQSMTLVTTQEQPAAPNARLAVALFRLNEAGIAAMSGNAVVFAGEDFSARSSIYWSVQGAHQSTAPTVAAISQASGDVSVSLARTANSYTVGVVGNAAGSSAFTNANPAESAEYNVLSSIGISYGGATDTARTTNFTSTVADSGLFSVGFAINIPEASSAPTISAGTPTGTVSSSPTVGFTTDTNSGTARIVIDTAANLSGVTATQVLAGQKNNSTAAAFDSGNITVTTTSPSYAFSGLQGGTTYTIAAAQNSTSNSNVLTWTFTVGVYPSGITTTSNQGSISVQTIEGVSITGEAITTSQGTLVPAVINNGTSGLGNTILDFGAGATTATATVIGQVNISSGSFADAFIMGTDTSTDHTADEHRDVILDVKVFNITPGTGFQIRAISSTTLTGKYRCRWVWTH